MRYGTFSNIWSHIGIQHFIPNVNKICKRKGIECDFIFLQNHGEHTSFTVRKSNQKIALTSFDYEVIKCGFLAWNDFLF